MKKILALALVSIMLLSLFGCGGEGTPSQPDNNAGTQQEENNSGTADNGSDAQQADNGSDAQQEEDGRSKATEFTFALAEDEERVVENLVFDGDVTISGDFGVIIFANCEFNGDVIHTAEQFTRVIFSDGTTVNGNCVFKNTVKEANMDYPMPKFIGPDTLNIVCEDCIGSFVLDGTEAGIVFNGETYSLANIEFYYDANTNELLPYDGQEVSSLFVGQWWENGEKVVQTFCE